MRINDIVNRWGSVKGLGGRVKNYFGRTISPNNIERVDFSKRRGNGAGLLYALLAAAVIYAMAYVNVNKSKAETIDIPEGWGVPEINQFFQNFQHSADDTDTINLPRNKEYHVYAPYTPGFVIPDFTNNVIWNWNGSQLIGPGKDNDEYGINVGGCRNLTINDPNVKNFQVYIKIGGDDPYGPEYENVQVIRGYCDTESGLGHTNVYGDGSVLSNSILLKDSIIEVDFIGVKYATLNAPTIKGFTKFVKNENVTANIREGGIYARLPRVTQVLPLNVGALEAEVGELLGSDPNSFQYVALTGSATSLFPPDQQGDLESPMWVAQENVENPYLNANKHCFEVADMNFVPGTYTPDVNSSPLVVKDEGGRVIGYLGSTPPPVEGDLDGDGDVDFKDYGVLANSIGSKPGDANWNEECDIVEDNEINYKDLEKFRSQWLWDIYFLKENGGLLSSKATNLPEGQLSPGENDYAVVSNDVSAEIIIPFS